jgi:hypothetical protein
MPAAEDQEPPPYAHRSEPFLPLRHIEIGPLLGFSLRPSAEPERAEYGAGLAFGAHARVNLWRWLGVRAIVTRAAHPVTVPTGGLGLEGAEISQPSLEVTLLAARIEPTWPLTPRTRAFGGLEVGWAYLMAHKPEVAGGITAPSRRGTTLEPGLALGASYDVVPHWLSLGGALRGALSLAEAGAITRPAQAIDGSGRRIVFEAFPGFDASLSFVAFLDLVL